MNSSSFDIQKIRVASPCHVGWETMSGDERRRLCSQCGLNVYNIQGLTSLEIRDLVENREGRLCIRLFRRTDGTVVTKDCPVGVRALRQRTAKFAGAALTAILGLFSVSFSQKLNAEDIRNVKIVHTEHQNKESNLKGVITDPNGAIIPSVTIRIFKEGTKKELAKTVSNNMGEFIFLDLVPGKYRIETKFRKNLFKRLVIQNLELIQNKDTELKIVLEVAGEEVVVGIFVDEPLIDTSSSSITRTITRRMIDSLPR